MVLSRKHVLPLRTNVEARSEDLRRSRTEALCTGDDGVTLFRRSLAEQSDEAWEALRRDSEENYIAQTFGVNTLSRVDAVVELLGQTIHAGWFGGLFVHGSRKKKQQALF
jgi:hypothetical protein